MHQESVGILSEYQRNGCSLLCVQDTGKLSCCCYCWNKLSIWRCSLSWNKLKLWNQPLLTKPRKAERAFLEWLTLENHPLEDLHYPPRLCANTEENPPKRCLKLYQNPPMGKGWPLTQSQSSKPSKETQSGAPKIWTASSLSRLRSLWMHCSSKRAKHQSSCKILMGQPHPSRSPSELRVRSGGYLALTRLYL